MQQRSVCTSRVTEEFTDRPGSHDKDPGSIPSTFPESGLSERRWFQWCTSRVDRDHQLCCHRCSRETAVSHRQCCSWSCCSELSSNSTTTQRTQTQWNYWYAPQIVNLWRKLLLNRLMDINITWHVEWWSSYMTTDQCSCCGYIYLLICCLNSAIIYWYQFLQLMCAAV